MLYDFLDFGVDPLGKSLHARTSATPCTPHTGVIKITYDGFEGYVPKDVTVLGLYASTSTVADALSVTFCSPSDVDEAFDITTLVSASFICAAVDILTNAME